MNQAEDRLQRFGRAESFAVYYGHGQAERLAEFDLAIVEPQGQNGETLQLMHEAGTLVVAYVSVTEVPDYDPFLPLLKPEDFLTVNGAPVTNPHFDTRLVDLRSRNWTNLLLFRIGQHIRLAGYDGIFLDTISNVEWPALPPGIRAEQQEAAVALVRQLRELYPGHLLLQNNGLEVLCEQTAPYMNGYCWENPDFVKPETHDWHDGIRRKLRSLAKAHPAIRVLALMEESTLSESALEEAVYWAGRESYLLYRAPKHYLDVIPRDEQMKTTKK